MGWKFRRGLVAGFVPAIGVGFNQGMADPASGGTGLVGGGLDSVGGAVGVVSSGGGGSGFQPEVERTLDLQVIASADDAREDEEYRDTETLTAFLRMWSDPDIAFRYDSGFRFQNVTIPQGATIISAYIEWYADAQGGPAQDASFNFFGHDIDNAPAFQPGAGQADIYNRAKTSAFVFYDDTGIADGWWGSAYDIKSIIQEIVNRPGWVSGNALALVTESTVIASYLDVRAFDHPTNPDSAKLHVVYRK